MEVVKFTNDTYRSLSDNIITSFSDKKEIVCIIAQQGKRFWRKQVVELVYKLYEKSYRECLKRRVDR